MSDFGEGSELGTVECGGQRALDDLLGGEYDADGSSVPGWLQEQRSDVEDGSIGGDEEVDDGVLEEELAEFSMPYQLSFRGQVYGMSSRGRVPVSGTVKSEMRDEKLFHCPTTIYLPSVEDDAICDKLRKGRLVANVVAKTGGGKSTRFPAHVAVKCGMRVLFVVPDARLKQFSGEMLAQILSPSRIWTEEKVAELVLLTPMEVIGRFMGSGWYDLDKHFDCIIVDESHLPVASMYALRAAFATLNIGSVSLLFLTATTGQADMQEIVEPEYVDVAIEDAFSAPGFDEGPYAVDRTLVIVESDERVRHVAALLNSHGLDVYTLESSAVTATVESVSAHLRAATASMRFVVAHEQFGFGYNFPVNRVLTTATTSILVQRDGVWFYGPSLLSELEIQQQMGRAGRGMADSSRRGVVFAPRHLIPQYRNLRPSEYFDAYVYLTAMNIRPRASIVDAVKEEVPFGLSPRVAAGLLTMSMLPPRMALRLLDSEARFPKRFVTGAKQFATIGGVSPIGGLAEPLGYDRWQEVRLQSVLGFGGSRCVKLPVKAKGELAVHLTLLCAAASGLYKPRRTYELEMSGYESGPDLGRRPGKFISRARPMLPAVYQRELVQEDPSVVETDFGYSLEVTLDSQPVYGKRFAHRVPNVVTEHLASGGYTVGVPDVAYARSHDGKEYVKLDFASAPVDLHSPGGSVAFRVARDIWEVMVRGEPLGVKRFQRLMNRVGEEVVAFANCDAFSVWGNPWLSVLATCADDEVLQFIALKNASSWLASFLAGLWKRYVNGMKRAVMDSHQVAGLWRDLVNKFNSSMKKSYGIGGGSNSRLPRVAQSEAFYERVYEIRELFSVVMQAMEDNRMFDPGRVADLQRVLPISRRLDDRLHDGIRRGHVRALSEQDKNSLLARFKSATG